MDRKTALGPLRHRPRQERRAQRTPGPHYETYLHEELGKDAYEQLVLEAREKKQKQPQLPGELEYKAYAELRYRTQKSWSCERRVVGKAAITKGKVNPRFIVTDITGEEEWARETAAFQGGQQIYEDYYCARGDMENRIKEQQMDMFADRTSTSKMASNQLRLWFSTFAYMLVRSQAPGWRRRVSGRSDSSSSRSRRS
ncbi:MAG: hypothetical protein ACI9NC_005546 [Verrucomicrobiales bacterium]|jgi:hypothetical protein